ncbi:breast cancer anti-estrogen resistance protein 1-like [Sinocyclocheilus rhinocerous]|uniref:breast cancer anti-estrogen resistance protein 1-like n=1 Tax=Sinocyclocheilus rhinocerous TaxID=307959 RepID=UPI0007BA63E6|nr:PREDICTED: breast cancer anti-estrogen resistance protein 1-like [Sinocyclocheilus rhinocerous]
MRFKVKNVLAKALYDNVAESPDELSFRKGDIMTVLERDTQGLEGWWLCSLHGRQGIVPGNRLKILVGMYDKQQQQQLQQPTSQPSPTQSHLNLPQSAYSKLPPASQYTAMHPAFSSSSANSTNPDGIYMLPPSHGLPAPSSLYQVPTGPQPPQPQPKAPAVAQKQSQAQYPPSPQDIYQVPPTAGGPCLGQDVYQVPPSMNQTQDIYQIPPSIEKSWDSPKPMGKSFEQRTVTTALHSTSSLCKYLVSTSLIEKGGAAWQEERASHGESQKQHAGRHRGRTQAVRLPPWHHMGEYSPSPESPAALDRDRNQAIHDTQRTVSERTNVETWIKATVFNKSKHTGYSQQGMAGDTRT